MQNGRRGFTLIELLVVIAIIAVLAAIIFPVYALVTQKARNASDLSNLSQIGLSFRQYLSDNDNNAPPFLWGQDWRGGPEYCPINPQAKWIAPNDRVAKTTPDRKISYQEDGYGNVLYNYWGLRGDDVSTDVVQAARVNGYGWGSVWGLRPTDPPPQQPRWNPSDLTTCVADDLQAGAAPPAAYDCKRTDFPALVNRSRPQYTIITWSPYQRKDENDTTPSPYDKGTVGILRVDGSVKTIAHDRANALFLAPSGGLAPIATQSAR